MSKSVIDENLPIVYVTRDSERAEAILSMAGSKNYSIISGNGEKDTLELLNSLEVQKEIDAKRAAILVFKNTIQIEKLAQEKGWLLLNPSAELAEKIENKITQVGWLGELASLLPPHKIGLAKNVSWQGKPFILQWAHSHTGEGTFLVENQETLDKVVSGFPERYARISDFIHGPAFTLNATASKNKIYLGNISYQITGLSPFTDNQMSTIGNDWHLPYKILDGKQRDEMYSIANKVGQKMLESGWKGLFGIDVILDKHSGKLYLIEINARQPASTTFESELQLARVGGIESAVAQNEMTIFEAHLSSLLGIDTKKEVIKIEDGAQIVKRITTMDSDAKKYKIAELEKLGYKVREYKNAKLNGDQFRVQSNKGLMSDHNVLNSAGQKISKVFE